MSVSKFGDATAGTGFPVAGGIVDIPGDQTATIALGVIPGAVRSGSFASYLPRGVYTVSAGGNGMISANGRRLTNGLVFASGSDLTDFKYISTDAWTQSNVVFTNSGNFSVAYGDSKYVVVGTGTNILHVSTNLTTWTSVNSGAAVPLTSIAYSTTLGLWALTGDSGDIRTSTDLVTWTQRTSNTTVSVYAVMSGSPGFVAAVRDQQRGRFSTNGITWATMTISANTWDAACSAWIGTGYLFAGSSGSLAYSTNGTTWSFQTPPVAPSGGFGANGLSHNLTASVTVVTSQNGWAYWLTNAAASAPTWNAIPNATGLNASLVDYGGAVVTDNGSLIIGSAQGAGFQGNFIYSPDRINYQMVSSGLSGINQSMSLPYCSQTALVNGSVVVFTSADSTSPQRVAVATSTSTAFGAIVEWKAPMTEPS